jgi:hypothetical protein
MKSGVRLSWRADSSLVITIHRAGRKDARAWHPRSAVQPAGAFVMERLLTDFTEL